MDGTKLQTALKARGYDVGIIDGAAGPRTYAAFFSYVAGHDLGELGLQYGRAAVIHFPDFSITTPLRLAHWMAQAAIESGRFTQLEENLNYSAQRAMQVWPGRFRTVEAAQRFAHQPMLLANFAYGGRMGNTKPNDGWTYRGRGFGITGRGNYNRAVAQTGLPLIEQPELLSIPDNAVLVFCAYWRAAGINNPADRDDLDAVTRAVNGELIGISDRQAVLKRVKAVLF